jgi:hypothetical protein
LISFNFVTLSSLHTEATTAGHPGGTKPKPGVDNSSAKGGEGHLMCNNKTEKGYKDEKGGRGA